MRRPNLSAFFAFLLLTISLFAGSPAQAWDEKNEMQESRNRLTVSGDYSHFTVNGESLLGTGIRVDFAHFLTQRSAVDVLISTSLTEGTNVSSTFTGFAAYYYYSPFTDCCMQNRTVSINGLAILAEQRPKTSLFQIGLGVNEYLLNGSKNVYSASGLGLSGAFTFQIWEHDIKTSVTYSKLATNGIPISALFLTAGLGFNL